MTRYTPPSDGRDEPSPLQRRSLTIRIGVWVLLIGILALVFSNIVAALI